MADLITFPGARPRPAPGYRLLRFAADGSVRATLVILARDDAEARQQARERTDGLRAELWWSGRLLEHFAPGDHPVAASIRLIGDHEIPSHDPDVHPSRDTICESETTAIEKKRGNRESRKPKKTVPKNIAAALSMIYEAPT